MARNRVSCDLIFGILLWLPVATLLRFKSVCKSWYTLIQSSHFVYQHHRFTTLNQDHIRLIILDQLEEHKNIFLLSAQNNLKLLEFPHIHDPYQFNPVHLIASCNGIICLRQDRRVCLWNPATKQSTNLPLLPVLPLYCVMGFGFVVETNDYKVLCIDGNPTNPTTHIYSLISDSWTSIHSPDLNCEEKSVDYDLRAPYKNNVYCWLIQLCGLNCTFGSILSFDFTNQVFETIPLPKDTTQDFAVGLCILRENIACVIGSIDAVYCADAKAGYCEVWMLSDYSLKESWTKLYSIECLLVDLPLLVCSAMGYSVNGDFLLFIEYHKLFFYDLVAQQITKIIDLPGHGSPVVMYEESLVSIQKGGNSMVSVDKSEDQNGWMFINQPMTGNNCDDDSIPEDVVFQILLWLPVVSLLRFKLVCKSWYSFIKSSNFVAQHLRCHRQNDSDDINLILNSYSLYHYPVFEQTTHSVSHTSCTCLLSSLGFELLDLPLRDSWMYEGLRVFTSFDGIICLQVKGEGDPYLWNPATKQIRSVPAEDYNPVGFSFGFGFDVNTNDYKLVRFYGVHDGGVIDIAEVYSLSTDSWKRIEKEISPTFERIRSGLETPYRNGTYCWLALIDSTTYSHMIVLFDFSSEVFGTIALPDSINNNSSSSSLVKLSVLRENIACISVVEKEAEYGQCEIWMMNEFGVKESWTKLYMVEPFSQNWHLHIGYSVRNGDYLVLQMDGKLCTFDLVTQETKTLPVQLQGPENFQVVLYQESLVPIKRDTASGFLK